MTTAEVAHGWMSWHRVLMNRRAHLPRPAPLLMLVVGLVIVGVYYLLRALQVGKIGQPTDIGGGGILILGYVVSLIGLAWVIIDMVLSRP